MLISDAEAGFIASTYRDKRETHKADWLTKIKSNYTKVVDLPNTAASLANPVLTLRNEVNAALATLYNYLLAMIALQVMDIIVICALLLRKKHNIIPIPYFLFFVKIINRFSRTVRQSKLRVRIVKNIICFLNVSSSIVH